MAVESGFSLPLTHTPPLLRSIAEPESAAKRDSGKSAHIIQQIRLRREDTLIPRNYSQKSSLQKSYPGIGEPSIGVLDDPAVTARGENHLLVLQMDACDCLGYGFKTPVCCADMDAAMQDGAAIEFRDVSYDSPTGQNVLAGLNLTVQRGETLVLLGRSGSGKTTTLKLVNRLLVPARGEVLVEGRPVALKQDEVVRLRRGIGYVIQDVGLFPHFTVERNIGLVPRMEGWPEEKIRQRTREMLQLVGLEPQLSARYPHQLSGGQRQRVGVARALAADPAILLMDEPFGALDPLTRDELQREFLSLQQRLRKTVLFVTHDLNEALRLGSRIALLEAGKLLTVLVPHDFLHSTNSLAAAYVKAFAAGMSSAENGGGR
jgi:osmoprotectant transport system ATP-binding protein